MDKKVWLFANSLTSRVASTEVLKINNDIKTFYNTEKLNIIA